MADEFDLIIIGGGIAATAAAESYREHGGAGAVLMLTEEDRLPYRRTKLSKWLAKGFDADDLLIHPPEWYEENGIEVRTNTKVESLDTDAREIRDTEGRAWRYGNLLLATGGQPVQPGNIPREHDGQYFVLHSARDAERILNAARKAKKVLVVGMGVLSVELAAQMHQLGKKITVVGATPQLIPRHLNLRTAEMLEQLMSDAGIRLHFQEEILSVNRRKKGGYNVSMIRNSGSFDLIVFAVGLRARTELAEAAGLSTGSGIRVDRYLRTDDASILAAGDAAEHDGGHMTCLWHPAEYQGRIAGANAAGRVQEYDFKPFRFRTEVFGNYFFSVNKPLASDAAEMEEFEFETGERYRAFYFRNDELSGVVMANDRDNADLYERAVREQWSLDRAEEELF
ncbi:MAG: NAD(P)/FAD-dependent oxidoreductase [Spirochaetaceae bacterium]